MKMQSWNGAGHRWLLGALVVVGAAALVSCSANTSSEKPPIPTGASISSWHDNGAGGRYLLQVAQGRALAAGEKVVGVVRSDTDCEPDAQGLNHCHNTIELRDGRSIDVVDNHQMSRNRCLRPGEQIALTGVSSSWLVGTVSGS